MKKIQKIITVVSLAVSGVLAFYMFWQRFTLLHLGLLYDELYSMATAFPGFSWGYIWREMLLKDVNLPLFNFILYHIFPLTADYMHLLSALVSAATIPLVWFLAPKRWNLTQRFIFTALMSGSFALVQFAGIIRAYSFAVLAVSALTLQALSILDVLSAHKNPSAKRWSAFFFLRPIFYYGINCFHLCLLLKNRTKNRLFRYCGCICVLAAVGISHGAVDVRPRLLVVVHHPPCTGQF